MEAAALTRSRELEKGAPRRLLTDARLARLAAANDRPAFAEIYRRYQPELYRYCRSLLGEDEARDALQSTFVAAMRSLPGETRSIELKPWLYRIAHNESISIIRRHRPADPLEAAADVSVESVSASAERRLRLRQLVGDLGELSESQRGALVMRELNGLAYEEIATAFGISIAAAKQSVYKARISLQERAEGRDMLCSAVRETLSEKDGRLLTSRRIRAHLRGCSGCRDFRNAITARRTDLAYLAPPLAAAPAAELLSGLLGGGAKSAGGLTAAGVGGGAAKAIGTSVAAKAVAAGAATVAIGAAAIGVSAGLSERGESSPASAASETAGSGGVEAAKHGSSRDSGAARGESEKQGSAGSRSGGEAHGGGGKGGQQAGNAAQASGGRPGTLPVPAGPAAAGVTPGPPASTPSSGRPEVPAPVSPPAGPGAAGGASSSGSGQTPVPTIPAVPDAGKPVNPPVSVPAPPANLPGSPQG